MSSIGCQRLFFFSFLKKKKKKNSQAHIYDSSIYPNHRHNYGSIEHSCFIEICNVLFVFSACCITVVRARDSSCDLHFSGTANFYCHNIYSLGNPKKTTKSLNLDIIDKLTVTSPPGHQ